MERRQPKPKIIDPFLQEESMDSNQAPQTSYSLDKADQQEYAKKTKTPVKASKKRDLNTENILYKWYENLWIHNFIDKMSYLRSYW